MATKYDVLRALVELDRDKWGDQMGLHSVITDIIDTISESHGGEEELADQIYDLIADSFTPDRGGEAAASPSED
ncbi:MULTISPECIES: hypothetical protein [Microbacterium]|uniref:hypothetical protein n=1 Tax=Microbacterium TaxID=33882 RepID=UPI0026EE5755|nr:MULTISPECIES: hypothetical protein [Microbacterium]